MLKREITYEDADGDKVTETFYFNLNRVEVTRLQVSFKGGLEEHLREMIRSKDMEQLFKFFETLVLTSYGIREEDGRHFTKNDQLRDRFANSFAYEELITELATNEDAAATFLNGIMPKAVQEEAARLASEKTAMEKAAGAKTVMSLPDLSTIKD